MKSASQYTFARVPNVSRPRSRFDRSRTYKTTLDSGYLYPIYLDDVLPGDTFNLSLTAFMRLTTPIVPFMDNLYADFFFFFVPNRLVWEHWENFMGQQDNPGDSIDYLVPQVTPVEGDSFAVGSLADYFGLPTGVEGLSVDALPFRCYNLIWNEWFRDENLQDRAPETVSDETADDSNYVLLRRGKRHDYFTSALPWPQKGPGVELPLGASAPVYGKGTLGLEAPAGLVAAAAPLSLIRDPQTGNLGSDATIPSGTTGVMVSSDGSKSGLFADLSQASAATINSLRTAFQIQHLYEALARGGSRYQELVLSCFNVSIPDARLQRPEYLGGGQIPINIHSVVQTSGTSMDELYSMTPQGNLAAYGVAGGHVGFSKSFVEHGYVIGLVSIRADLTYQQGIDRMWSRRTRFDYYWPQLAHLGEQEILQKEIFATGVEADDNKVFGYQERWAEYKYGVSHITGQLRSSYAQSLDVWHLAQEFATAPTLSSTFIEDNPPVARVLAVQNRPQFIYDSLIKCNCVRVMPTYSVPGYCDHF